MSEIAKCPLCGKAPARHRSDGAVFRVFCCEHETYGDMAVKLWNRYAVAMELARALIAWMYGNDNEDYDNYKDAKMRVWEGFGK